MPRPSVAISWGFRSTGSGLYETDRSGKGCRTLTRDCAPGTSAGRGAACADRLLHCGLSGAGLPPVFSSPDHEVDVGLVAAEDGVEQGGKGAAGRVVGPPGECAAGVDAVREDGRLLRVATAERRRALDAGVPHPGQGHPGDRRTAPPLARLWRLDRARLRHPPGRLAGRPV